MPMLHGRGIAKQTQGVREIIHIGGCLTGLVRGKEDEVPDFIDKTEESEAAFWRLKRAADERRENRIKFVLAQEGEPLLTTLGRSVYISACILFDGLILTEVLFMTGKTALSWVLYGALLGFAVIFQREIYDKIFSLDISEIDFED